ncbi:MAG TPA: dipeptidase [Thermoanaerobaculia bacterium]|jgi:membrane dipeptidase|nr:dipeptidase [Thermoanaerobaculia bacterium]
MGFHAECLVLDGHTDVPTRLWESPVDLRLQQPGRHVDLPRLRQGGVDALVFALYVPASLSAERGWQHVLDLHRASEECLAGLTGAMEQVTTEEEIRRAARRGVVGVLLGLENGRPLLVPGALEACAAWGVRYVTLTHWASHEWCDASTDAPAHGGLSGDGVKIVREMVRRGILPDVSHVSDDAVRHVLDVSPVPIIASHSSARALCDHPRNLPDDLIREIARKDGVVMANTYPAFVDAAASRADKERGALLKPFLQETEEYLANPDKHVQERERLFAGHRLPPVPLSTFVDHVIHLVEMGGEEHVGIGTDFDGIPDALEGFEDVSRFPDLTAALLERGIDKAGVRLILGESFLRVLRRAEGAAEL